LEGLKGFEAISYYNGLAMAIVGASIVFMGLVVLSTAISQIHKLLMLWDDRRVYILRLKQSRVNVFNNRKVARPQEINYLKDIGKTIELYTPLIDQLGKSFQLADLYVLAEQHNLPHPHLTITRFRDKNILIPQGDGTFTWNSP